MIRPVAPRQVLRSLSFGGGAVNQTNVFLFIETIPTNGHSAEVRYTAGTRTALRFVLALLLFASIATGLEAHRTYKIPFKLDGGFILLSMKVNGKPAVMLLDTGAIDSLFKLSGKLTSR